MHSGSSEVDEVQSLTVLLGQLELTISVRNLGPDPAPLLSVVPAGPSSTSASEDSEAWSVVPSSPVPSSQIERIIATSTPGGLAALDLKHLEHLIGRFRGADRIWTAKARLGRAFRAGLLARRWLRGQPGGENSPGIPFSNCYYVVLRPRGSGPAFWTRNYGTYHQAVFEQVRGQEAFASESVSHAFPSQAECTAYLSGAGAPWPVERQ